MEDHVHHYQLPYVYTGVDTNDVDDNLEIKQSFNDDHHDQQLSSVSDSESGVSIGSNTIDQNQFLGLNNVLIGLDDDSKLYDLLRKRFVLGLGLLGEQVTDVNISRVSYGPSVMGLAKVKTFQIYSKATEEKNGVDDANVKYAWYGTSRDGIMKILNHGFGHGGEFENSGLFGSGVYLSHVDSPFESVKCSSIHEDGYRHVLLCRVLLGKMEVVHPGSEQTHPNSGEFDSGVDNLQSPNKYIVWSTHMNTHILPEFVIRFKTPPCLEQGLLSSSKPMKMPTSPWMPLTALISVLSSFLPRSTINLIAKHLSDYRARKIVRQELIRQVRQLTGDELLIRVIKCFRAKGRKSPITLSNSGGTI